MRFSLSIHARVGRAFVAFLRRSVRASHQIAGSKVRELSIALVNDQEMSTLHKRFLHIDSPTDVLTFPLEVDRRGTVIAGELVICLPEARRRAKLEGTSVRDELLLYAIHGLLHLSGHDDRTKRGFRKMHQLEDQILEQIGVGSVFKRPRDRRRR